MNLSSYLPLEKESIQAVSAVFRTISDPTRLSILFLLKRKELSVGHIAETLDMEQSAISHQLRTLRNSRLVKSKRVGKSVIYSLDDLHIFSILEQVLTHVEEERQE